MRYLFFLLHLAILIFSFSATGYAQEWTKFFSIKSGFDFYYDENISRFKDNTYLVWYRTIPRKKNNPGSWTELIELVKVDCALTRYKRLKGSRKYENRPLQKIGETSWIQFNPYDFDLALYNTACRARMER
jgi:hypothetical protein